MCILKYNIQIRKEITHISSTDQNKLCAQCALKTNFMKAMRKMDFILSATQLGFVYKLVFEFFVLRRFLCACVPS